jgi:hypothetical protein
VLAAAGTSARPSASGNRQTITVAEVGLVLSIPNGWRKVVDQANTAQYVSPDGRAQMIIRWSARVPSGVTARSLIEEELKTTAQTDPAFDPASVVTGSVQVGGQQGFGSEVYTFTGQDGRSLSEADRAVVIAGRAQYFFGFLALEAAFDSYTATFNEIIDTIKITGP